MYQPTPGTKVAVLINYLRQVGAVVGGKRFVTAGEFERETSVGRMSVNGLLVPAKAAGLVVCIRGAGYQLASVAPQGEGVAAPEVALDEAGIGTEPGPTAPAVGAFTVGVFSDGDVMLIGVAEIGDGFVRLNRGQVRSLLAFLRRYEADDLASA